MQLRTVTLLQFLVWESYPQCIIATWLNHGLPSHASGHQEVVELATWPCTCGTTTCDKNSSGVWHSDEDDINHCRPHGCSWQCSCICLLSTDVTRVSRCRNRHLYDFIIIMDVDEFLYFRPDANYTGNVNDWLFENTPEDNAALCLQVRPSPSHPSPRWVPCTFTAIRTKLRYGSRDHMQ